MITLQSIEIRPGDDSLIVLREETESGNNDLYISIPLQDLTVELESIKQKAVSLINP